MRRLYDLLRRRKLAYELLAEYDREPITFEAARLALLAHAESAAVSWADSVRAHAKRYSA